jgi:hypothetical protein
MNKKLMPHWRDLDEMPVLCQAHTCDLKIDGGDLRIWEARTSTEDGEPYKHTIYIERKEDGCWIDLGDYDGAYPPEAIMGCSAVEVWHHI